MQDMYPEWEQILYQPTHVESFSLFLLIYLWSSVCLCKCASLRVCKSSQICVSISLLSSVCVNVHVFVYVSALLQQ